MTIQATPRRMRTIDAAYAYVKSADPDTALTPTALRRWCVSGKLPTVRVGAGPRPKYLVNLDTLEAFLCGRTA